MISDDARHQIRVHLENVGAALIDLADGYPATSVESVAAQAENELACAMTLLIEAA
jgi:hypothetical protein